MKNLLLLLFVLISVISLAGGGGGSGGIGTPTSPPPSCATNPAAGNTCATATPICDLNGYCGSTAASYTADYWSELNSEFCGSIENNSFLIFTASSTTLNFNVWLTSSSTGDGIQIMVFTAAGNCSGAVTEYLCWSPGTGTAGPVSLSATGLTPGNQYYIMIDGFAGDVAEYIIGVQSGAEIPVDLASSISGANVCLGETIFLTASGGNGNYTWDPVPGLSGTTGQNVNITPTSAGTYDFTVTSATGNALCPSSNQATTTIEVINCSCTITASNTGDVCPSEQSGLAATQVTDATGYSWTGPNGYNSTLQNPGPITPPTTPGSYDYTVTATVPSGTCTSTTTIVVKPLPDAIVPASLTACNGELIPESVLESNPTGATFTWTNSNTSIGLGAAGSGNIPTFTASNTTSSNADGSVSVTPTLNGCVGTSETVNITIYPTPSVNAISDQQLCHGANVTAVSITGPVSGTTFDWTNSNTNIGLAASGAGNIASFTASNTTNSAVTATITVNSIANGCVGTSTDFDIVVNPLPTVVAPNDYAICANTTTIVSGSGANTYLWNNNVTDGVGFTPTQTATYTVTGTDLNGCSNTDQVIVTVNPIPQVNAGQDHAICTGASTTLTATGDALSYAWDNSVSDGVSFSPTNTVTYTVTATSTNNCINTDQVVVTVNPLPNVHAGADQTICDNQTITLSGTGAQTYVWDNGVTNGQAFPALPGTVTYTVVGTDANGCINTDQVTINVLASPVAGIDPDNIVGYSPMIVVFDNTSSNASSFTWNYGNGSTGNSTGTSSTTNSYSDVGSYIVTLVASNGVCSDDATVTITVLPFPDAIITPPNVFTPNGDGNNDVFTIDVQFGKTMFVQIFNRWGNLMYEINDFTKGWNGADAADGVYFYKYVVTDMNDKEYTGHGNVTLIR